MIYQTFKYKGLGDRAFIVSSLLTKELKSWQLLIPIDPELGGQFIWSIDLTSFFREARSRGNSLYQPPLLRICKKLATAGDDLQSSPFSPGFAILF
ncbi:MAG: hypothetical protein A2066_02220 [Bacteroidetes bacterium GWB2_41_8]|nr:MAG: hypothetical protein A2066_02220 [Bacteroidetes bacterium GWB2_41_8]